MGKRVNYVTGKNGSGKSAILAGLRVALGASARMTERGSSLRDLVRGKGQLPDVQQAVVRVVLGNEGPDAFRLEEYGPFITIEKIIPVSGSGRMTLRAYGGKIVSDKRVELEALLDHHNIQINNPMALMTQETAKSFLSNSTPEDKFRFFMNATQVAHVLRDLGAVSSQIENITTGTEHKAQSLPALRAAMEEARAALNDLQAMRNLEVEADALKKELFWAIIRDQEAVIASLRGDDLAKAEAAAEALVRQIAEEGAEKDRLAAEEVAINGRLAAAVEASAAAREAMEEKNKKVAALRARAKEIKKNEAKSQRSLEAKLSAIDTARKDLEKAREEKRKKGSGGRDAHAERADLEAKLKAATEELSRLQAEVTRRSQELEGLEEAAERLRASKASSDSVASAKERAAKAAEQAINAERTAPGDRLARFGAHHAVIHRDLDQMMRQQRAFTERPIGPLGYYIEVADEHDRWAVAAQVAVAGIMNAYLVSSAEDEGKLRTYFRQLSQRVTGFRAPTVLMTGGFSPHRYNVPARPDGRLTALNVLRTDSVPVYNALVDFARAHNAVLIEGRNTLDVSAFLKAHRTTTTNNNNSNNSNNSNAASTIEQVREVIFASGDRQSIKGSSETYASLPSKFTKLLRCDPKARLEELDRVARAAKADLERAQSDARGFSDELRVTQANLSKGKGEVGQLRAKCSVAEKKVKQLQREVADAQGEAAIALLTAEDAQIIETENEIASHEGDLAVLRAQLADDTRRREQADADVIAEQRSKKGNGGGGGGGGGDDDEEDPEAAHERLVADLKALEDRMARCGNKLAKLEGKLRAEQAKVKDVKVALGKAEDQLEGELRRATAEMQPRVESDRKSKSILLELSQVTQRIDKEARRRKDSPEKIQARFTAARAAFEKAERMVRGGEALAAALTEASKLRQQAAHRINQDLQTCIRRGFTTRLMKRGHQGSLFFDANKGTLTINVNVDASSSSALLAGGKTDANPKERKKLKLNDVIDSKGLSGGERSFVTISLLLSLWETMEIPTFAVDEFDVFLDDRSRELALQLMLEFADQDSRQFIILTPKQTGFHADETHRIHKLADPIRSNEN
jgi:chromosome segregation ATPase